MKDHVIEALKVWGVNGVTVGVVSLTDIETVFKIMLTAATLVWTVIKIINLIRGDKKQ